MSRQEIDAWASAYIQGQQDPTLLQDGNSLWWTVEKFMPQQCCGASPEDCWAAILSVLTQDPPAKVLGVLAAGPLEDLIHYFGPEFIERIETESRRNASFRHLLGGVWQSSTPEIWARVQKAQGQRW